MTVKTWPEVRLGDLISIKHGWAFKSECFSEYQPGQPVLVNIGNFRYTGGFRFDSTTLKAYAGNYPKEYVLEPGDILLVMTCQTSGGEILGIPGRIPNDGRVYLHNQRMGKVVVIEPTKIDLNFLYWLFLTPEFNRELFTTASGTKILHTSPNRIEAFRFRLPSLPIQQRIADILSALDDKIECNRRINQTLEAMARTLYKNLFVDFRPFHNREFVDSESGKIPKGWKVLELSDVCDVNARTVSLSTAPKIIKSLSLK